MKKLVFLALVVGLLALTANSVEAGLFKKRGGCNDCAPATDCGAVTWVEKEVTCYRTEMRTQVVPTVVTRTVAKQVQEEYKYTAMVPETTQEKRTITTYKCVAKEVPYTYTVNVAVPAQEKRTVTTYRCVAKEVPYTYTVNVAVPAQEKRTITTYKCVAKEVPYTYTVNVAVPAQEKRTVTTYKCVPEEVTQKVQVNRWVASDCAPSCDDCGGRKRRLCRRGSDGNCAPAGQYVCEWQDVRRTVLRSVPETTEVLVNVCRYEQQQRQAVRYVSEMVPETREVLVNVCRYEQQQQQGVRIVNEMVPETREVLVNVCRYEQQQQQAVRYVTETVPETREVLVNVTTCKPVEKTGVRTRIVCESVQETVNVTKCYYERVPYTTKVRVPVCAPPAPCQ